MIVTYQPQASQNKRLSSSSGVDRILRFNANPLF